MVQKIVIESKLPTILEASTLVATKVASPLRKSPPKQKPPQTPPSTPPQPPPKQKPRTLTTLVRKYYRNNKRERSQDDLHPASDVSQALIVVEAEAENLERPAKGRRFSSSTSVHSRSTDAGDTLEDELEKEYIDFLGDQPRVEIDIGDHVLFPNQTTWEVPPSTPESQRLFEHID